MFTGIVTSLGEIINITPLGLDKRFSIVATPAFSHLVIGESIAVNGACLTVESFEEHLFQAFASSETLKVTALSDLARGQKVNLERALALGDRLGGHLVSGHIDAVATIERITKQGKSCKIRLNIPEHLAPLVIHKGSVTLDGISLTVNDCGNNFVEVNIIPETQGTTTINSWGVGKRINFEADILGKYVQKLLQYGKEPSGEHSPQGITMNFLHDNGY